MKSLAAALALSLLAAGCVSVAPQTPGPTNGPTAAATGAVTTPAPATLAPTASATEEPTLAPTEPPTAEPTTTPEATPQPTASSDPGVPTRDLLFLDDLSDPQSGWDEVDEDLASVLYGASGAIEYRFNEIGWAYTVRVLEEAETVVRPIGEFLANGTGIFGLMCGNTVDTHYAAVATTDGGIIFASIIGGQVNALERNDEVGLDISATASTIMGLQCTLLADGSLNMVLVVQGSGPVAVYKVEDAGITSFDVVGLYGEALDPAFTLDVDDAAAFGLGGASGEMSAEATALLAHIPSDFQTDCFESPTPPLFSEPATAVVTCILQTSGDAAEIAEYAQFESKQDMDDAYQARVDAFGVTPEGSCATGPNEASWNFGAEDFGRVQCAPQAIGIRFDWTDDRLDVMSTLVDFDGDYPSTYEQWTNAALEE